MVCYDENNIFYLFHFTIQERKKIVMTPNSHSASQMGPGIYSFLTHCLTKSHWFWSHMLVAVLLHHPSFNCITLWRQQPLSSARCRLITCNHTTDTCRLPQAIACPLKVLHILLIYGVIKLVSMRELRLRHRGESEAAARYLNQCPPQFLCVSCWC